MFPKMHEVVPEGSSGKVAVKHFEVSERAAETTMFRAFSHPDAYVRPGKYARLVVNGATMMSDTDMEQRTNREVVSQARGNVLISGLGLGMILHPIAAKEEVTSITVVELDPDVIKLVSPTVPSKATVATAC